MSMAWIILAILVALVDQLSKYYVSMNIEYGEKLPVVNNFFYLTFHENKGAAWGLFQNARVFLIIITAIASVAMTIFIIRSKCRYLQFSLSLVLGGALGNLADRIAKGAVTDFLDFYFGRYNFPAFNMADSFIVIGGALLAYYLLFLYKEA
jgi:signal peptidase II